MNLASRATGTLVRGGMSVGKIVPACVLLVALIAAWGARPGWSTPAGEAELKGTVNDPSHEVLGGARVRIVNPGSGWKRTCLTDSRGRYLLKVPEGTYEVSAELMGFVGETVSNVTLREGRSRQLDFSLRIQGAATSTESRR
jgi:hypothetical protein